MQVAAVAWSKQPTVDACTSNNTMNARGESSVHLRTDSETYDNTRKPQLPNFDHFLRSTGHLELKDHNLERLPTALSSSSHGQSSLPTPPATSGPKWLDEGQYERYLESQYAVADNQDDMQGQSQRRPSLAPPFRSRPQPRHARAYSSTNVTLANNNVMSWQHGQVFHEETVAGKATCYVYDDGSRCPKEVDGDTVNPKWGTTKAGKPRKRLGQACNTCREKKIKCDPNFPKCSQCQRFNRDCKFDANSRQGHRSPQFHTSTSSLGTTGTYSSEECASRKTSVAPTEASTPTDVVHRANSKSSPRLDETLSPTMSERRVSDAPTPSKRQRLSAGPADQSMENNFAGIKYHDTMSTHQHGFSADSDPLLIEPVLTKGYLEAYMSSVNSPTFEIFPPNRFMQWATNGQSKSRRDKIVLYAVMAVGSSYSTGPDAATHREIFKKIASDEVDRFESESYDLKLAQILLFLSFAGFVDGEQNMSFSMFARAVGCIAWMQLNLEPLQPSSDSVYDFPPDIHAECRRRTYWMAYTFDTYMAIMVGAPRLLNRSGIYLRLPCATHYYENGSIPTLPVFDQENVLPSTLTVQDHLDLGDMAYFLQISSIFNEVQLNAWHGRQCRRLGTQHYQEQPVRESLEGRLKNWAKTYEEAVRIKTAKSREFEPTSRKPLQLATRTMKFAGLDLLYHWALMELHRRIYHHTLSEAEVVQHAKMANVHAVEILKLAHQVMSRGGAETRDYSYITRGPVAGFAVVTAIDIITAAGKNGDVLENQSKLMELMYTSLNLLEALSNYWNVARLQRDLVKERIQTVFSTAQTALSERKTFFYCTHSMVPLLEKEVDLIYGTDRKRYLRAAYGMNEGVNDTDIYEINTKSTLEGLAST